VAGPPIVSYSLSVSLLVDIAERAHVSVEGVVRVLTREPVSDAIKERVLAVLDELDAEQTRVLQRFALAALHDVLPRPYEAPLRSPAEADWDPAAPEAVRGLLPPAPAPIPAPESQQLPAAAPPETAHLVQLSAVLEELASAVRDLREETDTERRERVDDLAVLIELISTGWQGLDRRLGRLERQLGRLESGQQPEASTHVPVSPPVRTPPAPEVDTRETMDAPPAVPPPPTPPLAEPSAKGERDRLPLAAALALVGVVVGTVAALQLVSGDAETAGVFTAGGNGALVETAEEEAPTTAAETRATTTQAATTATTTAGETRATTPQAATTAPRQTTTRPRATPPTSTTTAVLGTEAEQPGTTTAPRASGFTPTRNWAWAPVADADYYAVQFLHDGASLYRSTTRVPRLTLPDSVEFRPGSYRWIVRPGFGSPSAARLGAPVVDSGFTVSR
jgi:hypothetical protein